MIVIFNGQKIFDLHDLLETLLLFVCAFSVSVIQRLTFWAPEKA